MQRKSVLHPNSGSILDLLGSQNSEGKNICKSEYVQNDKSKCIEQTGQLFWNFQQKDWCAFHDRLVIISQIWCK